MSKNPSYTTLTKGSTFYIESGPNEGTKVKATRLRLNKYETIVEYEGHNGVRFITGEIAITKWDKSQSFVINPTEEQRVKFAEAAAERVAKHAKEMKKEHNARAHAEAFIAKHKAQTEAPLVWSEPTRKVGYKGRTITYVSTATAKAFKGRGFDIELVDERHEVEAQLHFETNGDWDGTNYIEMREWVIRTCGYRANLDRGLAYYKCLEMALKELNDLSVAEPVGPVAEPEAVAA